MRVSVQVCVVLNFAVLCSLYTITSRRSPIFRSLNLALGVVVARARSYVMLCSALVRSLLTAH
jgi:hypothetical protein